MTQYRKFRTYIAIRTVGIEPTSSTELYPLKLCPYTSTLLLKYEGLPLHSRHC